jgi:hypothetical protein
MIAVKFTKLGANSHFGAFAPGDLARVPNNVAVHLVEEVKCAVYLNTAVHSMPFPADDPNQRNHKRLETQITPPKTRKRKEKTA